MKLIPVSALALVAAAALAAGASAQVAGPLPPPPPTGGRVASTLFDAMMAIERATVPNPSAARTAGLTYDAAIQQLNAGDSARALASAQNAIIQAAMPPLPQPSLMPPPIPQPTFYEMHNIHDTDQADAESYVGLARRALTSCGAPNTAAAPALMQQYAHAVDAIVSRDYDGAKTTSQNIVNQCAAATTAYAAQQATLVAASPTPLVMGSYSPVPVATLIPDPALQQTPAPVATMAPTPAPEQHHFLFFR